MAYLDRHIKFATERPGVVAFLTVLFGYMAGEQFADLSAKSHPISNLFLFMLLFGSVFQGIVLTQTICQLRFGSSDCSPSGEPKSEANGLLTNHPDFTQNLYAGTGGSQ